MTERTPVTFLLDNCVWAFGCPCGVLAALVLTGMAGSALGWWP